MSEQGNDRPVDMVRWTFTIDPARRADVESYLLDLGLDVHVRGDARFVVTWDEPEGDVDGVVDELWSVHGAPFEVTHEEFRRLEHFVFHHDDAEDDADRAVA